MLRSIVVLTFFGIFLFSAGARADFGRENCVGSITATTNITADPVLAKIGDVIGTYVVDGVVTSCGVEISRAIYYMSWQPLDPLSPGNNWRCQTSVSGVALEAPRGERYACARDVVFGGESTRVGSILGQADVEDGRYPKSFTSLTFNFIKTGNISAGPNLLRPINPSVGSYGVVRSFGGDRELWWNSNAGELPPGEIIGTTCSLASPVIPVDFGDATIGDTESFSISFDSCTDQQDALSYNNAISLEFSSGQAIQPDGSALQNCTDSDCAKGLQIELQDSSGRPINLVTPYKLTTNNPVVGANTLDYTFNAKLLANPSEPVTGGKIDTQLVFSTIVE